MSFDDLMEDEYYKDRGRVLIDAKEYQRLKSLESKTLKLPDEIVGTDCEYKRGWNQCREVVWRLNTPPTPSKFKCPSCDSEGFDQSVLGPNRCTFCDGTEGGNPPEEEGSK